MSDKVAESRRYSQDRSTLFSGFSELIRPYGFFLAVAADGREHGIG